MTVNGAIQRGCSNISCSNNFVVDQWFAQHTTWYERVVIDFIKISFITHWAMYKPSWHKQPAALVFVVSGVCERVIVSHSVATRVCFFHFDWNERDRALCSGGPLGEIWVQNSRGLSCRSGPDLSCYHSQYHRQSENDGRR